MLSGAVPLLLVGAGKMGGAMLDRWLARGVDGRQVSIVDPFLEATRLAGLRAAGVTVVADPVELSRMSPRVVVLAVKPQAMLAALPAIAPLAGSEAAIVSIAAGIRLDRLEAAFPAGQPVVRAMPNTPAQIGMGMTVAVSNAAVSPAQRSAVDALLAAVGEVAWVDDEALMDGVTAVSGSGPAYVFLLAECLAEAGREAGLPADLAERLARRTVAGAGALLAHSAQPTAMLRQNVTSPNGTTAAALAVLMGDNGLQPVLTLAVAAAKRRSIELG